MMLGGAAKVWFDAAELAELKLPGLPGTKRKINEHAALKKWALKTNDRGEPLARPRQGRGGGLQYHVSLLPPAAMLELLRRGVVAETVAVQAALQESQSPQAAADLESGRLWDWFDRQSKATKDEAQRRLRAVNLVEQLASQPTVTRTVAVASAAAQFDVKTSTIWNWLALVKGAKPTDWLPKLAPHRVGGGAEVEIDPGAWTFFKSDYLRPAAPTYAACYHRLVNDYAKPRGLSVPSLKTLQRKLEREVDGRLIVAKRSGQDALRATIPAQRRTVADLHALELVNIDGHRWDVFVRWPDGKVARPVMVAIQDVYSRKFLAYRVGETESAVLTRLAFADLFKTWGIPDACLMDNGRAFASKWITGGIANRFRFKVREEEPKGLLTDLGVKIHWALPFRGSSKPIERAFGDFCAHIAKHPAFAGAYTGNRPDAKPEDYGTRAVDLETFLAVVSRGIAAHNARPGRRTEVARGRSIDQAFEESYTRAAIRKAGPEQMRYALLAADQVRADRKSGAISLFGNRYWCDDLYDLAGQRVTVRFDPDNLHSEVHVYAADGRYVASAPVIEAVGFLDAEAAQRRARMEADLRRKVKAVEKAEALLSADQLAALIPAYSDEDEATAPAPTVIRPVRVRGRGGAAAVALQGESAPADVPIIDRFAAAMERLETEPERRRFSVMDGGLK